MRRLTKHAMVPAFDLIQAMADHIDERRAGIENHPIRRKLDNSGVLPNGLKNRFCLRKRSLGSTQFILSFL